MIANTTTATGLAVHCVLDTDQYPTGVKCTAKDVGTQPITRPDFHAEWNCTLQPTRPKTTDYFVAGYRGNNWSVNRFQSDQMWMSWVSG